MIKPIPGYIQYLITESGEIYSRSTGERVNSDTVKKPHQRPGVRLYVNGYRSSRKLIDKLVFMTYKPKEYLPNGYCLHKDNNVFNNHIDNLEMVDYDPYSKALNCRIRGCHKDGSEMMFKNHHELAKHLDITVNRARAITLDPKERKDGWIYERC